MRRARRLVGVALAVGLVLGFAPAPSKAAEPTTFEATIAVPGGGADSTAITACPDGGGASGTTYAFFDLKEDFTFFKVSGPPHVVNEPSPVGVHAVNDYDLDLWVFDAKCKQLPDANSDAGVERLDTKRPARYALVQYFTGVIPQIPITLEAANSKIK